MYRVLVVDDSKIDRALVKSILQGDPSVDLSFAANGAEAINNLAQQQPDLLLTDLIMPELDGLQVVKQMREQIPHIPVVLMTSRGSEAIAIEALQAGAASFVPKSRLADLLMDTIHQVLDLKLQSNPFRDVVSCLKKADVEFHFGNDIDLIPKLVELIQKSLCSSGNCDATESIRLSLAVEEALLNALVHGNLELTREVVGDGIRPTADYFQVRLGSAPYKDRKIHLQVSITEKQISFVVEDEGPGFDTSVLPDSQDVKALQDGAGRGLRLMHSFMDEVVYNSHGNSLRLVRQFS